MKNSIFANTISLKAIFLTLGLLKGELSAQDINGRLIPIRILQNYKETEVTIYEKFSEEMIECAENLIKSDEFSKAYKKVLASKKAEHLTQCKKIVKDWWNKMANPIRINTRTKLQNEVYSRIQIDFNPSTTFFFSTLADDASWWWGFHKFSTYATASNFKNINIVKEVSHSVQNGVGFSSLKTQIEQYWQVIIDDNSTLLEKEKQSQEKKKIQAKKQAKEKEKEQSLEKVGFTPLSRKKEKERLDNSLMPEYLIAQKEDVNASLGYTPSLSSRTLRESHESYIKETQGSFVQKNQKNSNSFSSKALPVTISTPVLTTICIKMENLIGEDNYKKLMEIKHPDGAHFIMREWAHIKVGCYNKTKDESIAILGSQLGDIDQATLVFKLINNPTADSGWQKLSQNESITKLTEKNRKFVAEVVLFALEKCPQGFPPRPAPIRGTGTVGKAW